MPVTYFNAEEMRCKDGSPYPPDFADRWVRLRGLLDAIREAWGAPIVIVSGYRSPEYNAKLASKSEGVAKKSQHTEGRAADIRPGGKREPDDVDRLYAFIMNMYDTGRLPDLGGIGRYNGWVHVDTRHRMEGQVLARWDGRPTRDRTV